MIYLNIYKYKLFFYMSIEIYIFKKVQIYVDIDLLWGRLAIAAGKTVLWNKCPRLEVIWCKYLKRGLSSLSIV